MQYLHEHGVLDELIRSFADNGFFERQPLIVVKERKLGWVAVEGNRRLAALKILTGAPEAEDLGLVPALDRPVTPEESDRVKKVPVYKVANRDEVRKYLGYRHIGGIKTWPAEAKARYLLEEADRAAEREVPNPWLRRSSESRQ